MNKLSYEETNLTNTILLNNKQTTTLKKHELYIYFIDLFPFFAKVTEKYLELLCGLACSYQICFCISLLFKTVSLSNSLSLVNFMRVDMSLSSLLVFFTVQVYVLQSTTLHPFYVHINIYTTIISYGSRPNTLRSSCSSSKILKK